MNKSKSTTDGESRVRRLEVVECAHPDENITAVLDGHDEALIITANPDKTGANISVVSKLKDQGVLSSYLAELLKNLLNTNGKTKRKRQRRNISHQTAVG